MRTRNYYLRHWGYVIIRRACPVDEFICNVFPALQKFRGNCSYGLFGVDFRDSDGKVDFILVCLRKQTALRYDSLCRRFPKAYITRIPKNESPSEVARKWRIKHGRGNYVPPIMPYGGFKESVKLKNISEIYEFDEFGRERENDGFMEHFENCFDRKFKEISDNEKTE